MNEIEFPVNGRCACGETHYEMARDPMFVHCCHCSWCQRESGSAFAINALIETEHVQIIQGKAEKTQVPSSSGAGQIVVRCPTCKVALWSHYGAAGEKVAFVRVGTLDNPNTCPPDIHIYTASKQNWVALASSANQVEEYYRRSAFWPVESVRRYKSVLS